MSLVRRYRTVLGTCLLAVLPTFAVAADREGIPAGPWLLAPWMSGSIQVESNVFRQPEQTEQTDRVAETQLGLLAILPFRESSLELEYTGNQLNYADSNFQRDSTQIGGVKLELRFSTGDKLILRDNYRRDFARASESIDSGSETFVGEPFNFNRWELELRREMPGRQGYLVRVRRQDFNYEGTADIGFFNYRGFDNEFDYRLPLPSNKHWIVSYGTRRFNHYEAGPGAPVGIPFRKEKSDNVMTGISGLLGEDQPYRVQLGYGQFSYDQLSSASPESSEFGGVVGYASWSIKTGGRSALDLTLWRRPLPSNFSTYYINNRFAADFAREWLNFEAGVELVSTLNQYADVVSTIDCGGEKREDWTVDSEVYWEWKLHERFRFGVSSYYERRDSNCALADYDAMGFEGGFKLGWF